MSRISSFVIAVALAVVLASALKEDARCDQEPVQLLVTEESDTKVHLAPEALEFLRAPERANRKVVPVVVVGTARSGKSFFLGMITGCRNLFPLGHSLKQKTRGARMFPMEPLVQKEGDEDKPLFLLIDTEGLGNAQNLHDKALLLFSTMASSHMVYHLAKRIEQKDIQQLSSIAQLVKVFNKNNITGAIELPPVTWVVDQCTLDDPGDSLSYLYDELLRELANPADVPSIALYNETVRAVRNEFRSHKAFFIRPAHKDSDEWSKLSSYSVEDLDPRYVTQLNAVRDVLMEEKPKRFLKSSQPMSCADYATFLEVIMDAVNDEMIDMNHVMDNVVQQAVDAGKKTYNDSMALLSLPVEQHEWDEANANAASEAVRIFNENIVDNKNSFRNARGRRELDAFIIQLSRLYQRDNVDASEALCREVLVDVERLLKEQVDRSQSSAEYDENATNIIRSAIERLVGPRTYDCIDRMNHRKDLQRQTIAVREAPKQVTYVFFVSLVCLVASSYIGSWVRNVPILGLLTGLISTVAFGTSIVFGASVFGFISLSQDRMIEWLYHPMTILQNQAVFAALGCVPLVLFLLLYLSRPSRPSAFKPIVDQNLSPRCCIVECENCPSLEDAEKIALYIFKTVEPGCPVAVFGRNRAANIRFMPPAGKRFLVVAGPRGNPSLKHIRNSFAGAKRTKEQDLSVVSITQGSGSIYTLRQQFEQVWRESTPLDKRSAGLDKNLPNWNVDSGWAMHHRPSPYN